jgi:hypothetical protein
MARDHFASYYDLVGFSTVWKQLQVANFSALLHEMAKKIRPR